MKHTMMTALALLLSATTAGAGLYGGGGYDEPEPQVDRGPDHGQGPSAHSEGARDTWDDDEDCFFCLVDKPKDEPESVVVVPPVVVPPAVVPLPPAALLLGVGLGGLVMLRRRRR